jgi:hypothetical protein
MLASLRELLPDLTRAAAAARTGGRGEYAVSETGAADALNPEPWPGYAKLNAGQVVARLGELSQRDLSVVAAYERAGRNRRSVIERVDALTAEEPWPGYDDLDAHEIERRLRADGAIASRVRDYEARHRRRVPVLEAAQRAVAR